MMTNRRRVAGRTAAWTAAGLLGLGALAGVAHAVSGTPSPAPSVGPASPERDRGDAAKPGHDRHHGPLGRLGRQVQHGELVVRARDGFRTVVVQRGTVTSAGARSLTVRSDDGFTATYALGSETRIRKDRRAGQPGDLTDGDRATVIADKIGTTLTARVVQIRSPQPAGSSRSDRAPEGSGGRPGTAPTSEAEPGAFAATAA